jgi:hypothetical protein
MNYGSLHLNQQCVSNKKDKYKYNKTVNNVSKNTLIMISFFSHMPSNLINGKARYYKKPTMSIPHLGYI